MTGQMQKRPVMGGKNDRSERQKRPKSRQKRPANRYLIGVSNRDEQGSRPDGSAREVKIMISAFNFKPHDRGAIVGFFDLRYHGLTIRGCRIMNTNGGYWFSFPQRQGEQDGQVRYFEVMHLTPPETEHVRTLVLAELEAQGFISRPSKQAGKPRTTTRPDTPPSARPTHITPEGEDLSEYYTQPGDDDIPF